MELEIAAPCPALPGWSKTGRRTRSARGHHQMQHDLTVASDDDEARGFTILESDGFVAESLPPKKRKVESCHRCNICGRCFSSYQALGGHKAHHNAKPHQAPPPPQRAAIHDDAAVVSSTEHRCTSCYKVFSKGQALGGHRRHCQRPMAENGGRVFRFDLNEVPPEWFES